MAIPLTLCPGFSPVLVPSDIINLMIFLIHYNQIRRQWLNVYSHTEWVGHQLEILRIDNHNNNNSNASVTTKQMTNPQQLTSIDRPPVSIIPFTRKYQLRAIIVRPFHWLVSSQHSYKLIDLIIIINRIKCWPPHFRFKLLSLNQYNITWIPF